MMPPEAIDAPSENPGPMERRVLMANPRGFCAGVERAIEAVEQALARHGAPVFVRRAIVHNRTVVERLERNGAVFVQEIEQIPQGAIAILSAHGSARTVMAAAKSRKLRVVDAICPLVAKVHAEVKGWYRAGRHILLIGHQGHPEIFGTVGQVPAGAISVIAAETDLDALNLPLNIPVAYAVQTTFGDRDASTVIAAIQSRFADCAGPRATDICYATTNRQSAVEVLAPQCDLILVVGDVSSSNANRLVEVSRAAGCNGSYLVASADDLPDDLIMNARAIGVTSAASTPEHLVTAIGSALKERGFRMLEVPGASESIRFKPVALGPLDHPPPAG